MKKVFLFSLMIVLVFMATAAYATEKYALGNSNVALKIDYFSFTDDVFDNVDLDAGPYIGLEAYYGIIPNLYVGLESGWAGTSNDGSIDDIDFDIDVNFVPIELNLKYAFDLSPEWVLDLGAGASYNWFNVRVHSHDFKDVDEDDWVFGGQVFADVIYKLNNQWFIGINGKYQITEDLEFEVQDEDIETSTNANNWRAGAQVGYMF